MKIIERNLQEIGKSLLVSLPKEWTKAFHLKKGSRIKIMTSEQGFLSIAPEFTVQERKREAEIDFDEHFKRRFFREYFNGNEKITILLPKISEKQRKEVYSFLKRFISVQIIEESESKLIVKSFKIEELTIEECLKRIYFLSLGMIEELSSNNDKTMLKEMRDNMTRFYYIMVMQIRRFLEEGKFTKENQIPLIRALDFRMVAEKMQRIGEITESFGKINNKLLKQIKEIEKYYSKTVMIFINNNYEKAPLAWSGGKDIEKQLKKTLKQTTNSKNLFLYQQIKNLLQILRYTEEIAALIR